MTTLIKQYSSLGGIGRCDSNCYDAKSAPCECICQGMNHGKGLARAKANTDAEGEKWIKKWNEAHPEKQLNLFNK